MLQINKVGIFILIMIVFIFSKQMVFAQSSILSDTKESTYESCNCGKKNTVDTATSSICQQYCGSYALNDFMVLIKRIADIILKFSGSLALLAIVIGGVMFLISSGNKTLVERGRATMIGATIGLFIVFFSYVIINFSYNLLTAESTKKDDPFTAGYSEIKK